MPNINQSQELLKIRESENKGKKNKKKQELNSLRIPQDELISLLIEEVKNYS